MSVMSFPLSNDRVCVVVEKIPGRKRNQYRLLTGEDNMGMLPAGTRVFEFEGNIFDPEGNEIKPTGRFLMTVETIDPFHLVTDMF